jgi:hypothetical protein
MTEVIARVCRANTQLPQSRRDSSRCPFVVAKTLVSGVKFDDNLPII